jgi:hypothetical protein
VPIGAVDAAAAGADVDRVVSEGVDEAAPDAGEHPSNHGATVSAAASAETPSGFDNHGQFVKSVATDNHGQTTAAASVAKHATEHAADHAKGGPAAP